MKKYIFLTLAFGVALLGLQIAQAEGLNLPQRGSGEMRAYAIDTQTANLGTGTTQTQKKPVTKKKTKKTKKKAVVNKTAAKKAGTKKSAAKKSAKKVTTVNLGTTADTIEPADFGAPKSDDPTQQILDSTAQTIVDGQNKSDQPKTDDPPLASPEPASRKIPAKGFAFASLAGTSGLALVYLLRKLFFH